MRVFVTGIGGFVGAHLARRARAAGDTVAGSHLEPETEVRARLGDAAVELVHADIEDHEQLATALAATRPDAVIHLAALSHVGESWQRPAEYYRVNVGGTEAVLDAMAAAAPAAKLVFASSSEVYGEVPEVEQPIAAPRPVAPRTPYALTKAAAERLVLRSRHRGGAVVVRSFNLVGPGQSIRFALPAFATQLAAIARGAQEPVLRVGNLSARRDFLHVADGADGYLLAARRGEPGTTYNLATGRAHSIAHALDRLRAVSGVTARVEEDPERLRPVDIPLLSGDAEPLRQLGWSPAHDLDGAVADLWRATKGEQGDE